MHTHPPHLVFEVDFMLTSRFLLARVPLPVDSWGEKTSVQLVLVSPGRLKCNGWWDVQNPAKQRAETTAVMLASCVQMTPYISTKAYVVYCTSVQQASFYYPTVLPPGKGTIINSAQSHAHLQQLILRQRAELLTQGNTEWLTFSCQLKQSYWWGIEWFKRKMGCWKTVPHSPFPLLCLWLLDQTVWLLHGSHGFLDIRVCACVCVAYSLLSPWVRPGHRHTTHSDSGSIILTARLQKLTHCKL